MNKLIRHFAELVVIILGITISLFFDELVDDLKRDKQEAYYLQSLLSNLQEDNSRLTKSLQTIKQVNASSDLLLKHCMENQQPDMQSANIANSQTSLLKHTIFAANTSVFEELKSTGSFVAIKNKTLKNGIFSYYGAVDNTRENDLSADDVINQFVYARLNDNLPLARLASIPEAHYHVLFQQVDSQKAQQHHIINKSINRQSLIDAITVRKGINMAQHSYYQGLHEKNKQLMEVIRQELNAKQ